LTVATRTRTGLEMEAAIDSYRRHLRAGSTVRDQTIDRVYAPRLRAFAAYLRAQGMPTDVGGIRREHIETYLLWLREEAPGRTGVGQKAATISIAFRTLRTFWRWLVDDDEIRVSPMEKLRPPKVDVEAPPVVTPQQQARLLKACSGKGFEERRDAALLLMLAATGMRRGELAGLTLEDLDPALDMVHVRAATTKGRFGRPVFVPREAATALDKYLRVRSSHHAAELPWLWLGKRGRLSDSGILQVVERRGRQAGIPGLYPHMFRHTFAHEALADGLQEHDVARMGGWRDTAMLGRYGASAATERSMAAFRRRDAAR